MSVAGADLQCNFSPIAYIQSHCTRFPQATVDQHRSVSPIKFWHLNGVSAFVAPVQVSTDPVYRQAIGITQRGSVQNLPGLSINM